MQYTKLTIIFVKTVLSATVVIVNKYTVEAGAGTTLTF